MKTTTSLEEVYELLEKVDDKLSKLKEEVRGMKEAKAEDKPKVREEYLRKLDMIRKGEFVKVKSVNEIL